MRRKGARSHRSGLLPLYVGVDPGLPLETPLPCAYTPAVAGSSGAVCLPFLARAFVLPVSKGGSPKGTARLMYLQYKTFVFALVTG